MQEAEEQGTSRSYTIRSNGPTARLDTCRICSAPAEPGQPLFYPCKCSGTIRYIHQDCLTTWLAHSKKKTCDVCKHPYSFTKVYATDMPTRLPPILLLRRIAQQSFFAMVFAVRAVAVAIIWLAVLPWVTVMTWRMYFSMGDSTAWWISDRPRPPDAPEIRNPFYFFYSDTTTVPRQGTFVARVVNHPLWSSLSSDIFTGQIIASLVVLTFVAVFLLREWISQNARPGVFEDEDLDPMPAQLPPVPLPPPPPQQLLEPPPVVVHPNPNVNDRIALAQRQRDAMRALDAMRAGAPEPTRPIRKRRYDLKRKEPEEEARVASGSRPTAPDRLLLGDDADFKFTFRSTTRLPLRVTRSASEPPFRSDSPNPDDREGSEPAHDAPSRTSSLQNLSSSSSSESLSAAKPNRRRRPPLPSTRLTESNPSTPAMSSPPTPLVSPSVVTYRAPEELGPEAGPSRWNGDYFDHQEGPSTYKGKGKARVETSDDEDTDMESEHARYFADLEDGNGSAKENDDGMPKLLALSDSEEEEEDEEEEEGLGSPGIGFDQEDVDGDLDEEEEEEDEDEDEIPEDANGGVRFDADAPIWQAIQIEDEEVAEVADGEMDGNVEDDMEGAMEAIGMRGPVYGVVQNAALMIFVLDTAIGLLVWIPFTLGKSTALLSLDPHRFLQILHLPIKAIRVITDPIVDSVMYLIVALLLPFVARLLYRTVNIVFLSILFLIAVLLGKERAEKTSEATSAAYLRVHQLSDQPLDQLLGWTTSVSSSAEPSPPKAFELSEYQVAVVNAAEPYFAALGKEVRVNAEQFQSAWTRLALGHGPKERVFAVALGYVVVMILVSIYLNLLTVGNMKTAGRAVRTAVREQLLVLKVATFIFIELVTFPLGCGIVLDVCTVFMFPEANIASRMAFFKQAPLTAMFYHWIAGTMFMYAFAVLLAGCRTLLRKGAMWFIKDPQDQNSHPIRDILDRPTMTQLRKICVSGVMYSIVVACVVSSVASLLYIGSKSILPFRWKNSREPLSTVPIDLIFLHMVLPYTMHYFRPRTGIKKASKALWRVLAGWLRLSSYFFGGRYPNEEYSTWRWSAFFYRSNADLDNPKNVKDGTFRRVPATDNISLPRDMRATAAVTEQGQPVDEEARKLIAMQDDEAIKAKRAVQEDYMVVYIPPHFRWRVFLFISILWVLGAVLLGVMVAIPIQLGRSFFQLVISHPVHDGYSFIAGTYLLWACYLIGRAVDRLDKRRQRRGGDEPRADLRLLVLKRGLLWVAKITYMILCLGFLIPTLIALVVDLYIILPIRLSLDATLVPRIRIVDSWAMGLLYAKIILHVMRTQAPNPITRGMQRITNNGWTHPDPVTATKEVIGPLVFGLLGMILLPGAVFLSAQQFIPFIPKNSRLLFMEVYPCIFVIVAGVRFSAVLYDMLSTWSQAIRDKEFLVEMRLRNLEPD
ncbi:hypothetical protein FB45DRAFT_1089571, partial [Roridomyces roridus]